MNAQVIERHRLGTLTKVGQGGQGVVYQTPRRPVSGVTARLLRIHSGRGLSLIATASTFAGGL
jgi:hypothetical protein